jgi:hypothetical protein
MYSNVNMAGTIPSELGLWRNMEYFLIWSSSFTGTIPSELGLATKLAELSMDSNVGIF